MTLGRVATLVGIALGVMVINVAVSVLYMVVYSYVVNPGHEKGYYDAHIKIAAPYCSIVAGIPLMFGAGLWIAGFWDGKLAVQSALVTWSGYAVIDLAFFAASGLTARVGVLVAVSLLTKLAAIYAGTLTAVSRAG